ncbi:RNA polymerase sigma factor [Spirosoma validum]|uniref:Uncharacterized protein n=1 Tax=Spirosoma validum TaxID=2771355 RepID=A0A927GBU7_9BACT|nr:hypothetical protein [Spirosoma validum]MBD2751855.1 hypothetical protein [Spirosoma validum]
MPPKLSDTSVLVDLIRNGFTAERKFIKAYLSEAQDIALNKYHIPENQSETLAKRALNAAIRTVRLDRWQPNLIRWMVQSQAMILRWQQNRFTEEDLHKVQNTIERYVRNHLGQRIGGELNLSQERVCGETFDIFFRKVKSPGFVLTSSLDTYLIGITINQIKSFARRQHRIPANTLFDTAKTNPDPQDVVLHEKLRFYRKSHRLVAQQLSRLDDKCLTIILQHYGIDSSRIDAVDEVLESNESMTETEFAALFDVALGPDSDSRKLKDIALDLGINPKKISEKHLDCLGKLVQNVIPTLLSEPDDSFVEAVRREMQTRLDEAQVRKQKKQLEKQRYASSRQA